MATAYLNRIGTAVPRHDVHDKFADYAPSLLKDERSRRVFARMVERAGIRHRFSVLEPDPRHDRLDTGNLFRRGAFPDTAARMRLYEAHALPLALAGLDALGFRGAAEGVTHLIVTSCTGFYAPGLDLQIVAHYGLDPGTERTVIGFMGCYAGMSALKLARHIVRSEPSARVLIVNLELCTLHLKETPDLEQILSFLIFADGCAASLVTAEPIGLELGSFHAAVLPDSADQITWTVGGDGFDMVLSGRVPPTVGARLPAQIAALLGGRSADEVDLWAVHPGGRSVLDAIEQGLRLNQGDLHFSRQILSRYGNMSSPTVMFVLKAILDSGTASGLGCAMAFGPGLTAESMVFHKAH